MSEVFYRSAIHGLGFFVNHRLIYLQLPTFIEQCLPFAFAYAFAPRVKTTTEFRRKLLEIEVKLLNVKRAQLYNFQVLAPCTKIPFNPPQLKLFGRNRKSSGVNCGKSNLTITWSDEGT